MKRNLWICLLILTMLFHGCAPDSGVVPPEAENTETTILDMSLLEDYSDSVSSEEMETMCNQIDQVLKQYASDYGVPEGDLPEAQEYLKLYFDHAKPHDSSTELIVCEYITDIPETIYDGVDMALVLGYRFSPSKIIRRSIYIGENSEYVGGFDDGIVGLGYLVRRITAINNPDDNQVESLEECVATGKTLIDSIAGESFAYNSHSFTRHYPCISDGVFFPRFVSAYVGNGVVDYSIDGSSASEEEVLYLVDAAGNEYMFYQAIGVVAIKYNGELVFFVLAPDIL